MKTVVIFLLILALARRFQELPKILFSPSLTYMSTSKSYDHLPVKHFVILALLIYKLYSTQHQNIEHIKNFYRKVVLEIDLPLSWIPTYRLAVFSPKHEDKKFSLFGLCNNFTSKLLQVLDHIPNRYAKQVWPVAVKSTAKSLRISGVQTFMHCELTIKCK